MDALILFTPFLPVAVVVAYKLLTRTAPDKKTSETSDSR